MDGSASNGGEKGVNMKDFRKENKINKLMDDFFIHEWEETLEELCELLVKTRGIEPWEAEEEVKLLCHRRRFYADRKEVMILEEDTSFWGEIEGEYAELF